MIVIIGAPKKDGIPKTATNYILCYIVHMTVDMIHLQLQALRAAAWVGALTAGCLAIAGKGGSEDPIRGLLRVALFMAIRGY